MPDAALRSGMILISFTLDGRETAIETAPLRPLLDLLRDDLGETAPKAGCGIGRCGACAVLIDGAPANACLLRAYQVQGRAVSTARGDADDAAIRAALAEAGVLQCGYCANGFVTSLAWLLRARPDATPDEIEQALAGHICRCSGYEGMRRAIAKLCAEPPMKTCSRKADADNRQN